LSPASTKSGFPIPVQLKKKRYINNLNRSITNNKTEKNNRDLPKEEKSRTG
jgi:hypothetical protein